jgi:hypothetical protein
MENQLNFISVAITFKNNSESLWSIKAEVFTNNELILFQLQLNLQNGLSLFRNKQNPCSLTTLDCTLFVNSKGTELLKIPNLMISRINFLRPLSLLECH